MAEEQKDALVVVFGSVSQSPRMLNHVNSLKESGYNVSLIGYGGKKSFGDKVKFLEIPDFGWTSKSSLPILILFRMIYLSVMRALVFLWLGLFKAGKPQIILVQNPPSIPTLLISPVLAWYHNAKYVIDWHNLGFTILGLQHGENSKLTLIYKRFELYLGKFGHIHLTVTEALRTWLLEHAGLPAEKVIVLYDRPNHSFHHLSLEDKHNFLERFFQSLNDEGWGAESHATWIDEDMGKVSYRPDRDRQTALVVSSTSWTADEDFGLLWEAILLCEDKLAKGGPRRNSLFPSILLVITGKGPMRSKYEDLFNSQRLYFFKIKTMWLDAADYPKLLASADLGISLHSSSSGLDLPMKIVDMMGCGLPVLAHSYPCIGELIEDEENGCIFDDAEHLSEQILSLFHGYPKSSKALKKMAQALIEKPLPSWRGHWKKNFLDKIATL